MVDTNEQKAAADKPRVMVTCTTTGSVRIETMSALTQLSGDDRFHVGLTIAHDRPYSHSLNRLAGMLVRDDGWDWWLHTDNDQVWTANPLEAIEHGKDLVGFPTPIYRPFGAQGVIMCYNAWTIPDESNPDRVAPVLNDSGFRRVDVIGSGSFLVRLSTLRAANIQAPFSRRWDETGQSVAGPDVEFCRKWRECGLTIWADFDRRCSHFTTVDVLQVAQDLHAYGRAQRHLGATQGEGNGDSPRIVRANRIPPTPKGPIPTRRVNPITGEEIPPEL